MLLITKLLVLLAANPTLDLACHSDVTVGVQVCAERTYWDDTLARVTSHHGDVTVTSTRRIPEPR